MHYNVQGHYSVNKGNMVYMRKTCKVYYGDQKKIQNNFQGVESKGKQGTSYISARANFMALLTTELFP